MLDHDESVALHAPVSTAYRHVLSFQEPSHGPRDVPIHDGASVDVVVSNDIGVGSIAPTIGARSRLTSILRWFLSPLELSRGMLPPTSCHTDGSRGQSVVPAP